MEKFWQVHTLWVNVCKSSGPHSSSWYIYCQDELTIKRLFIYIKCNFALKIRISLKSSCMAFSLTSSAAEGTKTMYILVIDNWSIKYLFIFNFQAIFKSIMLLRIYLASFLHDYTLLANYLILWKKILI